MLVAVCAVAAVVGEMSSSEDDQPVLVDFSEDDQPILVDVPVEGRILSGDVQRLCVADPASRWRFWHALSSRRIRFTADYLDAIKVSAANTTDM